jgi:hypothetical protein
MKSCCSTPASPRNTLQATDVYTRQSDTHPNMEDGVDPFSANMNVSSTQDLSSIPQHMPAPATPCSCRIVTPVSLTRIMPHMMVLLLPVQL